jgi:hypothetical protein
MQHLLLKQLLQSTKGLFCGKLAQLQIAAAMVPVPISRVAAAFDNRADTSVALFKIELERQAMEIIAIFQQQ